jgi:hypothetical protein
MIVYADTSVILRPLLGQKNALDWADWESAYSSEILGLEARRVIDRLRLESALDDTGVMNAHREMKRIEQCLGTVSLTRAVLRRAAMPMPTIVKTLDAIHLASALVLREKLNATVVFATHDSRQAAAAYALGFHVLGVCI